ncbi:MerR family transcriptional regulator [Nocardia sp. CA-135398]|uniref:MerR family transcriptional regulator n=1 Tax=Nocardia sp. CA-135398 TaxID=3239977 RepID=UPI003D9A0596
MKSSSGGEELAIGTVAARFGLATHVLRHWEALGLVTPDRDPAGRRRYSSDDVFRVAVILRAKEAGLGLDVVRALITAAGPDTRRDVLQRHRADLAATIAAAQTALAIVDGALGCEHDDFTRCPHFRATIADRISPDPAPHIPA